MPFWLFSPSSDFVRCWQIQWIFSSCWSFSISMHCLTTFLWSLSLSLHFQTKSWRPSTKSIHFPRTAMTNDETNQKQFHVLHTPGIGKIKSTLCSRTSALVSATCDCGQKVQTNLAGFQLLYERRELLTPIAGMATSVVGICPGSWKWKHRNLPRTHVMSRDGRESVHLYRHKPLSLGLAKPRFAQNG